MIYVTNFKLDKNDNFYPNYYFDNDGSTIKYYDMDLNLIKEKDYDKFGLDKYIIKNNKQDGGARKKRTPKEEAALEEKVDEELLKVQPSRWLLIKDLLLPTCYQDFSLYNSDLKKKRI